jgi:tight adherence protein B
MMMDLIVNSGVATLMTLGAVTMFTLIVTSILSRGFEVYQERYVVTSMSDLSDMFVFLDGRQILMLNISLAGLCFILGILFLGEFFTYLVTGLGFFIPKLLIRYLKYRRVNKFNVQLVDSLTAMSNAFKAGLSFPQAMEHVSMDAPAPLSQEFQVCIREIKLNVPIDDALNAMADRVGCEDLNLVVASTNIARQLGGNMAEMFDTIADTIRERFRLEGKIRSLTAQGRMQGWVVAALPLLLGLVLNVMRPDMIQPMFEHWFGYVLVLLIILMEVIGVMIIRKIVNIAV